MTIYHCGCCNRDIGGRDWDGLYTSCGGCAWCASLEHDPCHHGECSKYARVTAEDQAIDSIGDALCDAFARRAS